MAQGCIRFRTSDHDAVVAFARLGFTLSPQTLAVGKRTMHYVTIGVTDRPTLIFVHGSPGSRDSFTAYLKDSLLPERYRMVNLDRPGFGYCDSGYASYLEVITAQRSVPEAELALINTKQAQFLSLTDLYRALGGGWE